MTEKVNIQFGKKIKKFEVIHEPSPHILVESKKELHSWPAGKRECTEEKLLVNPYNGCEHACFFCYANLSERGYFDLFRKERVVTVCKDYDKEVGKQLDSIDIATCGYLSPVSDPFQPINEKYHLSEKIVEEFVKRNIPIEVVTKGVIPEKVIDLLANQEHSYGQVSILTPKEGIRRELTHGASTEKLFENLRRLSSQGIHAVCRLDPIIPYVTDDKEDLREIIEKAKKNGANHVIAGCMMIPAGISGDLQETLFNRLYQLKPDPKIRFERLYNEQIVGYLHADINYRRDLFSYLRELCKEYDISFALCMEFEFKDRRPRGLNKEFMLDTKSCEGIAVPVYVRKGNEFYVSSDGKEMRKFEPLESGCEYVCLNCKDAGCGFEELAFGKKNGIRKGFTIKDYRRWSKQFGEKQSKLF